jgi:hypothetical protein
LEKLWAALKDNISPPEDKKERINYNSFLTIASMLPIKVFIPSLQINSADTSLAHRHSLNLIEMSLEGLTLSPFFIQ